MLLLILCCFSPLAEIQGQAQRVTINGFKTNVKSGDSMEYIYSKVNTNRKNYFSMNLELVNATTVNVNITEGTIVKIVINNADNQFIDTNISYLIPGLPVLQINSNYYYGYLFPRRFDSLSAVKSYLSILNNSKSSITSNNTSSISQFTYFYDNTYIYAKVGTTFSNSKYKLFQTKNRVYNWHTSWMEYYTEKSFFTNNTLNNQINIDRMSNDVASFLSNNSVFFIAIGFPLVIVALIGTVWLNYKKELKSKNKLSKKPNYKNSKEGKFLTYFKSKMKAKKNPSVIKQTDINSSLQKLEQIIKENN